MLHSPTNIPCAGYGVAMLYADVEPEILASEDAQESQGPLESNYWQSYLDRVLPPDGNSSAADTAFSLLRTSAHEPAAIAHAHAMRRSAIGGGDVRRARFWAAVATTIATRAIQN